VGFFYSSCVAYQCTCIVSGFLGHVSWSLEFVYFACIYVFILDISCSLDRGF